MEKCGICKNLGIHVEITNLIIPCVNDDEECIKEIATKAKKIDKNIPLHFTRYYPAYKFTAPSTPVETLEKAWKIAKEVGLNYVYIGNIPGHKYENTYYHNCNELLIERFEFKVVKYKLTKENKCPKCGEKIPIVGEGRVSYF